VIIARAKTEAEAIFFTKDIRFIYLSKIFIDSFRFSLLLTLKKVFKSKLFFVCYVKKCKFQTFAQIQNIVRHLTFTFRQVKMRNLELLLQTEEPLHEIFIRNKFTGGFAPA
jgi:hypothetical protein